VAFTGAQLLDFLATSSFDLVVVALALPDTPSLDDAGALVAAVAARTHAPVAVLDDEGRFDPALHRNGAALVAPGQAAADDICSAALQRVHRQSSRIPRRLLRHGALELDEARRTARWHGRDVRLTKLQHRILVALLEADGAVLSRAELERRAYGTTMVNGGDRVVTQVRRIREKLEPDPGRPDFLLTVRGEGFRLAGRRPVEVAAG
jgi:DNA-binding response OmpR family regulator